MRILSSSTLVSRKMQLDEISLNEIKRDIALVTLNIENLGDANKEMAILHLKETIDLLQMSSQNKRVKVLEDYDAKESPEAIRA